jgi:fluoride ion exporter CrcB/FEX
MWGIDQWGEMIWGGGVPVPTLPLGMLCVLMFGCFVAGGYLLRAERRSLRHALAAALLLAIPISVGALTLPNTFVNGSVADATEVNANFSAIESALDGASCPVGMTRIELPHAVVCYATGPSASWTTASDFCFAQYTARLCDLQQWRDLVCRVGIPSPGVSWTDDITDAASIGVVSGCTSDGISSSSPFAQRATVCCQEWPRY